MSYTVQELITNSWYLSGIVSRNLQTVSGDQINDGLQLLNDVLGIKTANTRLIPYYQYNQYTFVPNQEEYFIANLLEVVSITFYIGSVRYSMLETNRFKYNASPRADNIGSLPYNWNCERTTGGANLKFYFFPSTNWNFYVEGKYGLTSVSDLQTNLDTIYDRFYIVYLRYALAEYMCQEYQITLPPQIQKKLDEIENIIVDIAPMDLNLQKISTLTQSNTINYGDVNIGKGFRP